MPVVYRLFHVHGYFYQEKNVHCISIIPRSCITIVLLTCSLRSETDMKFNMSIITYDFGRMDHKSTVNNDSVNDAK